MQFSSLGRAAEVAFRHLICGPSQPIQHFVAELCCKRSLTGLHISSLSNSSHHANCDEIIFKRSSLELEAYAQPIAYELDFALNFRCLKHKLCDTLYINRALCTVASLPIHFHLYTDKVL